MVKRMSAQEARAKFADLLGLVYYGKEPVIIEKGGRPFAVVINPEDYEKLLEDREARFKVFDDLRAKNPEVTPEQAEAEASREIAAFRQEKGQESEKRRKQVA
ncbi:MAG: type II toxin-antitoxin system Phd/YefM family antitoxin [Chloroflexi bacterium]|nr:type II toxin-antitoxin system Phd/YefM family antitoxin [Chloroflexota bacterium]